MSMHYITTNKHPLIEKRNSNFDEDVVHWTTFVEMRVIWLKTVEQNMISFVLRKNIPDCHIFLKSM